MLMALVIEIKIFQGKLLSRDHLGKEWMEMVVGFFI
jgi:hypothetical protein